MAKIDRKKFLPFGASGAASSFGQFGSKTAGTPQTSKDPDVIQSLAAWPGGWQDAIDGVNKNMFNEDMNGLCYVFSYMMANMLQDGIPAWEAGTEYFTGSIVRRDGTHELYGSLVDAENGNALPNKTDNAKWKYLSGNAIPTGAIIDYGGRVVSDGFLLCDASAVSRTTYSDLLSKITIPFIGTMILGNPGISGISDTTLMRTGDPLSGPGIATGAVVLTVDGVNDITMSLPATGNQVGVALLDAPFGVGDGTSTFNVPDSRRRGTVGADGIVVNGILDNRVGAVGGEEEHILTEPEMPAHTHLYLKGKWPGGVTATGFVGSNGNEGNQPTGISGGDQAHNNIQPSLVVTKMIKI